MRYAWVAERNERETLGIGKRGGGRRRGDEGGERVQLHSDSDCHEFKTWSVFKEERSYDHQ